MSTLHFECKFKVDGSSTEYPYQRVTDAEHVVYVTTFCPARETHEITSLLRSYFSTLLWVYPLYLKVFQEQHPLKDALCMSKLESFSITSVTCVSNVPSGSKVFYLRKAPCVYRIVDAINVTLPFQHHIRKRYDGTMWFNKVSRKVVVAGTTSSMKRVLYTPIDVRAHWFSCHFTVTGEDYDGYDSDPGDITEVTHEADGHICVFEDAIPPIDDVRLTLEISSVKENIRVNYFNGDFSDSNVVSYYSHTNPRIRQLKGIRFSNLTYMGVDHPVDEGGDAVTRAIVLRKAPFYPRCCETVHISETIPSLMTTGRTRERDKICELRDVTTILPYQLAHRTKTRPRQYHFEVEDFTVDRFDFEEYRNAH